MPSKALNTLPSHRQIVQSPWFYTAVQILPHLVLGWRECSYKLPKADSGREKAHPVYYSVRFLPRSTTLKKELLTASTTKGIAFFLASPMTLAAVSSMRGSLPSPGPMTIACNRSSIFIIFIEISSAVSIPFSLWCDWRMYGWTIRFGEYVFITQGCVRICRSCMIVCGGRSHLSSLGFADNVRHIRAYVYIPYQLKPLVRNAIYTCLVVPKHSRRKTGHPCSWILWVWCSTLSLT